MKLFKTVLGILVIIMLLFSPLYSSEKSGTFVNIHNVFDKLVHFNFVRFDHGIEGYAHVPATQHGGGINPKETLTSRNREPGEYAIRFWRTEEFEYTKIFFISKGLKEINITLDPNNADPIKLECDCSIEKVKSKKYRFGVYKLTSN